MKQQVRAQALRNRNALRVAQVKKNSALICRKLKPYLQEINGIYLPYGTEVDLTMLLQECNYRFAVPKTFCDMTIRFYLLDKETQLVKSTLGIYEPMDAEEIHALDVLIVPLVAFDEQCNRLGHGKGYYDRYLEHYKGLKIGVAHECQKVEQVYACSHDVPLDMIITEEKIYQRNPHQR